MQFCIEKCFCFLLFFFLPEKIVFTFHCWFLIADVSQQYFEKFRKIEQMELVENLPPPYPNIFCIIYSHLNYKET